MENNKHLNCIKHGINHTFHNYIEQGYGFFK